MVGMRVILIGNFKLLEWYFAPEDLFEMHLDPLPICTRTFAHNASILRMPTRIRCTPTCNLT